MLMLSSFVAGVFLLIVVAFVTCFPRKVFRLAARSFIVKARILLEQPIHNMKGFSFLFDLGNEHELLGGFLKPSLFVTFARENPEDMGNARGKSPVLPIGLPRRGHALLCLRTACRFIPI